MNYRRPSELGSSQLDAVTGRSASLPYEDYLAGAARGVPAAEEARYRRGVLEEERGLAEDSRRAATRDSNISTAVNVGNAGIRAYPLLKSAFGDKAVKETAQKGVGQLQGYYANEGAGVLRDSALNEGAKKFGETAGRKAFGATGSLAGGYLVGNQFRGSSFGEKAGDVLGFGGKKELNTAGGALTGAATGFATGGPVGALIGGVAGAVGANNKGPCIIVTACTDPGSYEVEIARQYRNKYMSLWQLRGYYYIAEYAVPLIERFNRVKSVVRKVLVDNLIDYGAYALHKKSKREKTFSFVISKMFLSLCGFIGDRIEPVKRSNGEVI